MTPQNIAAGGRHVAEKHKSEGFLALRIEHPDDRDQFEKAISDIGAIPVHERNREVVAVHFETLLLIAEKYGFLQPDKDAVLGALRELAPASEKLQELLTKDVRRIRWKDVRSVLNSVGAEAVAGAIDTKVTDLLKLLFPFLS